MMNKNKITVSEIHIYPIKSTAGISLEKSTLQKIGLVQDRRRAVVSVEKNRIITARENQKLFGIRTQILGHELLLTSPTSSLSAPLVPANAELVDVKPLKKIHGQESALANVNLNWRNNVQDV